MLVRQMSAMRTATAASERRVGCRHWVVQVVDGSLIMRKCCARSKDSSEPLPFFCIAANVCFRDTAKNAREIA